MKDPERMSIDELKAELKDCRNELCLRCGQYLVAHNGACNGCRWRRVPEGSVPDA